MKTSEALRVALDVVDAEVQDRIETTKRSEQDTWDLMAFMDVRAHLFNRLVAGDTRVRAALTREG